MNSGIAFALQDTVTGFLLAGIGNVDLRKKSNFLVVTESEYHQAALFLPHEAQGGL